jgi:recF protein
MYVTKLRYENYRNLENGEICPAPGMNVIYGENAQGKTNLLEGVWLFTGGHSFRGAKDSEIPRLDSEKGGNTSYTKLKMDFFSEERDQTAILSIQNGRRSSVINGVEKKTGTALVGKVCAVIFSPEHLLLVKEGPGRRRSFIDGAICQIKPGYAKIISSYNRCLMQRNALLKEISKNPAAADMLAVWNQRIAGYGAQVMLFRNEYVNKLMQKLDPIYRGISREREKMDIRHVLSVKLSEDFTQIQAQEAFLETLSKNEVSDIRTGFTTSGPHRDDLEIFINGLSARMFASQGQQRSAVLSMKLSESEILSESINETPLILLDDVMSELDAGRQDYLLNHLHDKQVFITCCAPETVNLMEKGRRFYVEDGKVATEE